MLVDEELLGQTSSTPVGVKPGLKRYELQIQIMILLQGTVIQTVRTHRIGYLKAADSLVGFAHAPP